MSYRKEPNILITGTHGTGKSCLSAKVAKKLNFLFTDVSQIVQKHNFIEEYNDEFECFILNEKKVLSHLRPIIQNGGNIVEFHDCEFFPESWFDAVFVVRCNSDILYERLLKRKYKCNKLQSNIQCEIYQNVLDEAYASYEPEIIFQIKSETGKDTQKNLVKITKWYVDWKRDYYYKMRRRLKEC